MEPGDNQSGQPRKFTVESVSLYDEEVEVVTIIEGRDDEELNGNVMNGAEAIDDYDDDFEDDDDDDDDNERGGENDDDDERGENNVDRGQVNDDGKNNDDDNERNDERGGDNDDDVCDDDGGEKDDNIVDRSEVNDDDDDDDERGGENNDDGGDDDDDDTERGENDDDERGDNIVDRGQVNDGGEKGDGGDDVCDDNESENDNINDDEVTDDDDGDNERGDTGDDDDNESEKDDHEHDDIVNRGGNDDDEDNERGDIGDDEDGKKGEVYDDDNEDRGHIHDEDNERGHIHDDDNEERGENDEILDDNDDDEEDVNTKEVMGRTEVNVDKEVISKGRNGVKDEAMPRSAEDKDVNNAKSEDNDNGKPSEEEEPVFLKPSMIKIDKELLREAESKVLPREYNYEAHLIQISDSKFSNLMAREFAGGLTPEVKGYIEEVQDYVDSMRNELINLRSENRLILNVLREDKIGKKDPRVNKLMINVLMNRRKISRLQVENTELVCMNEVYLNEIEKIQRSDADVLNLDDIRMKVDPSLNEFIEPGQSVVHLQPPEQNRHMVAGNYIESYEENGLPLPVGKLTHILKLFPGNDGREVTVEKLDSGSPVSMDEEEEEEAARVRPLMSEKPRKTEKKAASNKPCISNQQVKTKFAPTRPMDAKRERVKSSGVRLPALNPFAGVREATPIKPPKKLIKKGLEFVNSNTQLVFLGGIDLSSTEQPEEKPEEKDRTPSPNLSPVPIKSEIRAKARSGEKLPGNVLPNVQQLVEKMSRRNIKPTPKHVTTNITQPTDNLVGKHYSQRRLKNHLAQRQSAGKAQGIPLPNASSTVERPPRLPVSNARVEKVPKMPVSNARNSRGPVEIVPRSLVSNARKGPNETALRRPPVSNARVNKVPRSDARNLPVEKAHVPKIGRPTPTMRPPTGRTRPSYQNVQANDKHLTLPKIVGSTTAMEGTASTQSLQASRLGIKTSILPNLPLLKPPGRTKSPHSGKSTCSSFGMTPRPATPRSAAATRSATTRSVTPRSAETPRSAVTPRSAATNRSAGTPRSAATTRSATTRSATPRSAATTRSATPRSAATTRSATPQTAERPKWI